MSQCLAVETTKKHPVSFELDIQPILNASGCSAGSCHGKARGQNGFQLSLLCFDADFDHNSLVKNARGRRVFPASASESLLLKKAAGVAPHGGGVRWAPGGDEYQTVLRWIAEGATRRPAAEEPQLVRVTVSPTQRRLVPKEKQQLVVTAHYSNGTSKDVTRQSEYQSNESVIVKVGKDGVIQAGPLPGEATIMARYMGVIATCGVMIPLAGEVPDELYAQLPRNNFIDDLIWQKLKQLKITPSGPVDDTKFLRRVYIDIIGRLPTPDETRAFIADGSPNKRLTLINQLLERPEYADHWANKWADLLRPNPYRVGIKAVLNYDNWIREQFRRNAPYDEFARDLVTAQGSTWRNGAVTLFRDRRSPDEVTTLISQLFLGVRLECAKCHHHPFERWSQDDFYSFAAYFSRVGRKGTGLSPPISGGEEIVLVAKSGQVKHPTTGEVLPPRPLFGDAPEIAADDDPRVALAQWLTSKENHYFAEVIVNRVWADLMGRGLVEPVDDLRATNPPSNGPLLSQLAKSFQDSDYDFKQLIRTITTSYAYGLSSLPSERNVADTRNYSRHYRTRLRAEVMVDAMADITDQQFSFSGMPSGSRAMQIWTHRVSSLFLDTFGRPDPNQDPPCERTGESTVTQVLHLMNAPDLHKKVTADGARADQLAKSPRSNEQIVEEIYLLIYSRFPTEKEKEIGKQIFAGEGSSRRQAAEDLMWALLNTPEFVFKD
ncbi:MAG: DUF1549 and DUF1553 domain-containing protein [Pirellulaceae bacterium]|nr:DUF1549 and DUF1553 domain-containing protein [Pirellulaceae bacterium]